MCLLPQTINLSISFFACLHTPPYCSITNIFNPVGLSKLVCVHTNTDKNLDARTEVVCILVGFYKNWIIVDVIFDCFYVSLLWIECLCPPQIHTLKS